ncbi:saccharopine dehydrogenase NADP-binding domain-containing protein [Peristeroidobacter agariperforans]|uniref:saccharopine dehydrogenase NADP-binding domain-containing protein n=1 Tax=Peristeroidobacter agariperforans TaxID=268404 RepID=UPI00101B78C0|nr:saccharopine dehydrogenase NADP-binding domain-containing protein [Peristeroidobacter agariperforans]
MKQPSIGVYGATGHTGRLVAKEFAHRGYRLRLGGRRPDELESVARALEAESQVFACSDANATARFAEGLSVVVNCAGPFGATALPIAQAALAAGAHYVDTTGEPPVVSDLQQRLSDTAARQRCAVVPAVGFFGALPALLAHATADTWDSVEQITIAYALSGWRMTAGSRAAAAGLSGHRPVFCDGRLDIQIGPPRFGEWRFPDPIAAASVLVGYPAPEVVLLARRLARREVNVLMTASTLQEIRADAGYHDVAATERAASKFMVVAEVASDTARRVGYASGHDIYGITASLVGEITTRLTTHRPPSGVLAPFEIVPGKPLLESLPDLRLSFTETEARPHRR